MIVGEPEMLGQRPCCVNVDGPTQMVIVVGDGRTWMTVDSKKARDRSGCEVGSKFEEVSLIGDRSDRVSNVE